jgi:hypothetical protein
MSTPQSQKSISVRSMLVRFNHWWLIAMLPIGPIVMFIHWWLVTTVPIPVFDDRKTVICIIDVNCASVGKNQGDENQNDCF